jgi:hypothetical protein
MESNGMEVMGVVLMVATTFPLSFFLARLCLRGVMRVVTASGERAIR